jgi:magnesium chelatase family protein
LDDVRKRIASARAFQWERLSAGRLNARMTVPEVERFCGLDRAGEAIYAAAAAKLALTWRGIRQALTMARTIADLAGGGSIQAVHLAEAFQYQTFRLGLWD